MDLDALFKRHAAGQGVSRPPVSFYAANTERDTPIICTALPDPTSILSWDTETWKITDETGPVPPLVCVQTQFVTRENGKWIELPPVIWGADAEGKAQGVAFIFHVLESRPDISLISLNGFFDFAVLLKYLSWDLKYVQIVFKAFMEGRIRDCIARAKEHAVEYGWLDYDPSLGTRPRFDMEQLALKYLGESPVGKHGEDSYRLRYRELDGIPHPQWPDAARLYALLDPQWTQRIWRAICAQSTAPTDELMQTESAWQLYLATVNGIHHDPDKIAILESKILPVIKAGIERLINTKVKVESEDKLTGQFITKEVSVYTPGKKKLNKKVFGALLDQAFGGHAVRTLSGEVSLSEKQLKAAFNLTGNPLFNPKITGEERLRLAEQWDEENAGEDDSEDEQPDEDEQEAEARSSKLVLEDRPSKTMAAVYRLVADHYTQRGLSIPMTSPKPRHDPVTGQDLTAKPRIKTSRDVIEQVPCLKPLADIGAAQKVDSMYITGKPNKTAIFKRKSSHARWNHMVGTGRVSVSNPNLNNIPRMKGVRECFRARPGYILISADYAQAELCSLAQVCIDKFGHSRMAELIRDDYDLHLYLVSKLREQDYQWLVENKKLPDVKNDRQGAKAANFGFPGGLGLDKFIKYAADTFGILDMTREEAEEWKNIWKGEYPEMPVYFRWISAKVKSGPGELFTAVQHRSGRRRGRVGYTDGCNTYFQGLTADGAKYAMNLIGREAWCDPSSPIYGFRLVAFIYDEIFGEMPDRGPIANTRAAQRLCQIMKEAMELFTPDVPAKVEPAYQYNWSKGADPVWTMFEGEKVLLPWEHRGGKFVNRAGELVTLPPLLDISVLTTWDRRDYGELVRAEDVPEDILKELKV